MVTKRCGVLVEERNEQQEPYKLWHADLMECPECGAQVAVRFARGPVAEAWQPDYHAKRAREVEAGVRDGRPLFAGRCRPEYVTGPDPRD